MLSYSLTQYEPIFDGCCRIFYQNAPCIILKSVFKDKPLCISLTKRNRVKNFKLLGIQRASISKRNVGAESNGSELI